MILDNITTIINIILAISSFFGAFKARKYYKKCQIVKSYSDVRLSLDEIEKMIGILPKILSVTRNAKSNTRGVNFQKELSDIGSELNACLNKIQTLCPVEYSEELVLIINGNNSRLRDYINSLISGDIDFTTLNNADYTIFQAKLASVQDFIKQSYEKLNDKINL